MRLFRIVLWTGLVSLTLAGGDLRAAAAKPNIVFILADDLGYGDLGSFGQEKIRTPHLDRLAHEGLRLTQHYSGNAVCAPSRCVLLTGKHPGHAFIRDNREAKPEGQLPLPASEVTVARALKDAGYATAIVGKWGLGPMESEGSPLRQGFDRFFGYNCQRQAHNFYPAYLYDNDQRVPLKNPEFPAHQKFPAQGDASDAASYARYSGADYAPDLMRDAALKFVTENKTRPFFLYYATSAPHLALQVPDDSLKEYAGAFEETPYLGERGYLPHKTPRAAYAAMITRMDRDIGALMSRLTELGLDEKTIIVFSSDNGPLYDKLGGTDEEFFKSAGGLRGRKGSLYEGGIRVPTVVRWKGTVSAGGASARLSGFEDWMPTFLELAGIAEPSKKLDGISLVPTLRGKEQPERPFLYREFAGYGGWQVAREGSWKLVKQKLNARGANAEVQAELYDLASDPAESKNVAAAHPDVVARLEKILTEQHTKSEAFPLKSLD